MQATLRYPYMMELVYYMHLVLSSFMGRHSPAKDSAWKLRLMPVIDAFCSIRDMDRHARSFMWYRELSDISRSRRNVQAHVQKKQRPIVCDTILGDICAESTRIARSTLTPDAISAR